MGRVFNGLTEEERNDLRAVAKNILFLQKYRGYDDFKMAELWGDISLDTYEGYKTYGPGRAALKFINIAREENLDLNRFLLNDPEAPFFRKEPSIIKPYEYAIKLMGTAISLEPHMSAEEKNSIAVEYMKRLAPWLWDGADGNGKIL